MYTAYLPLTKRKERPARGAFLPMSMRDLRAVYGDKKATLVINAAIRAELPGGNEVLDAIHKSGQMKHNAPPEVKLGIAGCINLMAGIKQAMVSEILRRYEIEEVRDEQ